MKPKITWNKSIIKGCRHCIFCLNVEFSTIFNAWAFQYESCSKIFKNYKGKRKKKVHFHSYNYKRKTNYWNTFTLKFHVSSSFNWMIPKHSHFLEGAYNFKTQKKSHFRFSKAYFVFILMLELLWLCQRNRYIHSWTKFLYNVFHGLSYFLEQLGVIMQLYTEVL